MGENLTLMFREAASAPQCASRQLERNRDLVAEAAGRLRALDPPFALTIARGSSDHAASFAKHLLETRLHIPVASLPPSVTTLYQTKLKVRGALAIAISQSGRSPDLIEAAREVREAGATLVALVNDTASPLAREADILLPLHAGEERSVAATKSFIASLVAIADLVSRWREDEALRGALASVDDVLHRAWKQDWSAALEPLATCSRMLVLGRGPTLPIAGEAALKLKETCQIQGEAFSSAEVAHGPMTLVGEGDPVLAFVPHDAGAQGFAERLATFRERGARVLAIGTADAQLDGGIGLPQAKSTDPVVSAIAMIESFYRLAEALARMRGLDPDNPPYLSKVTQTR